MPLESFQSHNLVCDIKRKTVNNQEHNLSEKPVDEMIGRSLLRNPMTLLEHMFKEICIVSCLI